MMQFRPKIKKAKRLDQIPPYLFAQIDKKKAEVKAKGIDIVDLGVGDPDLPTPSWIVDALHQAIDDPKSFGYPPYEGTFEFREAVAAWYDGRFGVRLDPECEVIALIGSKEGLAHLSLAMLDPGDVALIPDPSYPVYKTGTLLAGGVPYAVELKAENHFLPDLRSIDKKVLKKARVLYLNYPNNPTGATAPKGFFEEAVKFAKENDLLICSDLAYSEIAYDGYVPPSILQIEGAKEVAIEFHSLSKTFNVTGYRIGMAVGNPEAVYALSTVKTNIDSGVYKAIQMASVRALTGPSDHLEEINKTYANRRDLLCKELEELGFEFEKPKAAFYIWVKVPKGYSSTQFVAELLEKTGVLVVPGSGYGKFGEGYFRISFTSSDDRIKEAVNRLKQWSS